VVPGAGGSGVLSSEALIELYFIVDDLVAMSSVINIVISWDILTFSLVMTMRSGVFQSGILEKASELDGGMRLRRQACETSRQARETSRQARETSLRA
jgi:hypothetical protein